MSEIIIDEEKCKACMICMEFCPKKLIKLGGETNSSGSRFAIFEDPDNHCLGCGICARCCPDIAIKEVVKD